MAFYSVREHAARLRSKDYSSRELTLCYLERIEKLDGRLNSVISIAAERALEEADQADKRIARGEQGPLLGIPILHKDIFCTAGFRTSCASRMLENFVPPYDARVVELLRNAGAVGMGKTNMDEFAMGSSSETSYFGPVINPWNAANVPGGSSGGSTASVSAGLALLATATDTGGSIRQPAALCGVTGIKPTYGRVSRYGMVAFASSLDQAGAVAHSAEDCAWMLEVMSGWDWRDSTCLNRPVPSYSVDLERPLSGLRIGLPRECFEVDLHADIRTLSEKALELYVELGAECVEISMPALEFTTPAYCMIAMAECSSNLSRYDGVRYGRRCEDARDLEDLYLRSRAEGFGREVKRRLMMGSYALSAGYYDAYYNRALKVRRLIYEEYQRAFLERGVQVIASPVSPDPAFQLGERVDDPVRMYLSDLLTIPANLAGLPALSHPIGFISENCPVGLQLVGPHWEESVILRAAHQFQKHSDWHGRVPPIASADLPDILGNA